MVTHTIDFVWNIKYTGYLSPEMESGEAQETSTDMFSAGVTLGIALQRHLQIPSMHQFGNNRCDFQTIRKDLLQYW
jgi:hypothetical protein